MSLLRRYTHWLHTRWPAGTVEKLPEVREDGTTAVPGLRVVGELTGVPLLKFAVDSGARAVRAILAEPEFGRADGRGPLDRPRKRGRGESGPTSAAAGGGGAAGGDAGPLDLAIIGGGLSGIAAAIEAKKAGLKFQVFEAARPFATIRDFPRGKPIYTYPADMTPAGELTVSAGVKEALVEELEAQRAAHGIEPTPARIDRVERRGGVLVLHGQRAGGATPEEIGRASCRERV